MPYSNRYRTHAKVTTGFPGTVVVDESSTSAKCGHILAPVALGAGIE